MRDANDAEDLEKIFIEKILDASDRLSKLATTEEVFVSKKSKTPGEHYYRRREKADVNGFRTAMIKLPHIIYSLPRDLLSIGYLTTLNAAITE